MGNGLGGRGTGVLERNSAQAVTLLWGRLLEPKRCDRKHHFGIIVLGGESLARLEKRSLNLGLNSTLKIGEE